MKLLEIVNGVNYKITGNVDVEVLGIEFDSRKVNKGDMFVCLKGKLDGNDYINEALSNGAIIVVTENENYINNQATVVYVKDSRFAYAKFCNNYFKKPNKNLKMIAITGTNGKTSTSYILQSILLAYGKKVGVIGTLGIKYLDKYIQTDLTTPDSFTINNAIFDMANCGIEYVIMEVSSHSIFYKKTAGIVFDYAIFTNLSQDHLDFFNNMYNYALTKMSFFNSDNIQVAVVNSDDFLGKCILSNNINFLEAKYGKDKTTGFSSDIYLKNCTKFKKIPKHSFGLDNPSDVFAIDIICSNRIEFIVNAFDEIYKVKSKLFGKHNVYNILSCIALCKIMQVPTKYIIQGIANIEGIEGRQNIIEHENNKIIIDFAHTEDALDNLLRTAKSICKGRLITIFGCGGNRDKDKREAMGRVASRYSDYVILTSDNPRNEKPIDIINDIKKGIFCKNCTIIDRFCAIKCGISMLKEKDILVIAGRGGEIYQEIYGKKIEFVDKEVVHKILRELNWQRCYF